MIDFKKIMNRTPEEKLADELAMEAREAKRQSDRLELIRSRKAIISQLDMDLIPEKHQRFARDLAYMSETYDMDGCLGGRLSNLTEKQVSYLDGLNKQYAKPSEKAFAKMKT